MFHDVELLRTSVNFHRIGSDAEDFAVKSWYGLQHARFFHMAILTENPCGAS